MCVFVQALLKAIETALENGMDDDCDTYYEAGILLDDLEHGTENASEESTTDRSLLSGDSYNGSCRLSACVWLVRLPRLQELFCLSRRGYR